MMYNAIYIDNCRVNWEKLIKTINFCIWSSQSDLRTENKVNKNENGGKNLNFLKVRSKKWKRIRKMMKKWLSDKKKWHRNMLQWLTSEDEYVSFLLKVPNIGRSFIFFLLWISLFGKLNSRNFQILWLLFLYPTFLYKSWYSWVADIFCW